jgi:hypothetical protein
MVSELAATKIVVEVACGLDIPFTTEMARGWNYEFETLKMKP